MTLESGLRYTREPPGKGVLSNLELTMPPFPPKIAHQIIEVLPDKPDYGEYGEGENATLDDKHLGIRYDGHFCALPLPPGGGGSPVFSFETCGRSSSCPKPRALIAARICWFPCESGAPYLGSHW